MGEKLAKLEIEPIGTSKPRELKGHDRQSMEFELSRLKERLEEIEKEKALVLERDRETRESLGEFFEVIKQATKNKKLINMAYEIRYLYEKLIESIEERLSICFSSCNSLSILFLSSTNLFSSSKDLWRWP